MTDLTSNTNSISLTGKEKKRLLFLKKQQIKEDAQQAKQYMLDLKEEKRQNER
jgi:hypothetical protein